MSSFHGYNQKNSSIKIIFEFIFSFISTLLYFTVLPFVWITNRIKKRPLYLTFQNRHQIPLRYFNIRTKLFKYLPLSLSILKGDVHLVGTDLDNIKQPKEYAGIISLYRLRSFSGINYLSMEDIDNEYLKESRFIYDIKLTIRFLPASILASSKKSYTSRLTLLGVRFLNTTMDEILTQIASMVKNGAKESIYFINADTLNKAYQKQIFKRILNKTPYVLPDGSGIKIACNILNTPIKQNINGTDLFPLLCEMASREGMKLFLYGAKEGVAQQVKQNMLKRYPNLQIVGTIKGFDIHDNEVINMINHSKADIVLVAKGAPLQEKWIDRHRHKISAPVVMGVGGLFDFYSGNIPRAPIWMREIGVEWIYRLIQEPQRMWRRYIIGNPLFLFRVFRWRKRQRREALKNYYQHVAAKQRWPLTLHLSYLAHKLYPITKRIMDIVVSLTAIILLSPLLIVVAILIKMEDGGSIFFSQTRIGRDGKPFKMYKFRSMRVDAEMLKEKLMKQNESKDGIIFKIKNDPRITHIGTFIRKWSIDELPQLFNILQGNMSLVGPRPPLPSEVEEYMIEDLKRLHILPGLTCYWQVSGRSEIPFKKQVELDKKYISRHSLWVDIKILFATIPAVFTKKGAC